MHQSNTREATTARKKIEQEMNPLVVQRIVLAWILGPLVLVVGCYLLAGLLGLPVEPESHSWLLGLGLFFASAGFFGIYFAAHAFVFFGLVGVLKLSRSQLPRKLSTLFVCLAAVAIGAVILAKLYFGLF